MSTNVCTAFLRTRCGCHREILLPYPPPPTYSVILKTDKLESELNASYSPLVRTFKFDRIFSDGKYFSVEYEER
jgi:hypothetical protein